MLKVRGAVVAAICLFWAGCTGHSGLPSPGSDAYRQLCAAFYLGLSALQSGEDVHAREGLTQTTLIAPGEPAGWADLGLLDFRQQDYDGAYAAVIKAQALVPTSSRMEALLGVIESRRGKANEALAHLQRAVSLDGRNLKALYGLAQETERENSDASDAAAQQLLERILTVQPNNLAVLVDLVRLSAKRNDAAAVRKSVASLKASEALWPPPAREQLATLEQQSQAATVRPAAVQAQFLRNVLVRVPAYRQSLDEVKTPVTSAGEPFLKFLKLPSPSSDPSEPDTAIAFQTKTLPEIGPSPLWLGTFVADENSAPSLLWADEHCLHTARGVQLDLPGTASAGPLKPHAVLAADLNYDFRNDLVVATSAGLRIYLQAGGGAFEDATARTRLEPAIVHASYTGAWAFDYDLDGDLDVVLGTAEGEPVVLRNNGDGTFRPVHPFRGIDGLRDFAVADIDGDGDPDVALLDKAGRLHVFANERLGDYRARSLGGVLAGKRHLALAAADVDGDGLPDFVLLDADGKIARLSDRDAGHALESGELAQAKPLPQDAPQPVLLVADIDNNGAVDLIAFNQIFLGDKTGFRALQQTLPAPVAALQEQPASGRTDLLTLAPGGSASRLTSTGAKHYHWQDVRPKAASTNGDQRINSFGIGGEMEVRADLLAQKQIIHSPVVHFGLGDHPQAQFARIVWPNGIIQTEFRPKPNQALVAEQRLKGSCPLLYCWNGRAMQFVKDVAPMSGALGAHDGSGHFAPVTQTEEWFKIAGDQLRPRAGTYDLRITDEYWEAYFIDRYSLRAVDHPPGTQVLIDERVATPAAPLAVYLTGASHAFAAARDDAGRDASAAISERDGRYLDTFARGAYQGIARDHWVELELPAEAPRAGPLYLVADGWLHPWDDGILVAVNQGISPKPDDLRVEVPDAQGRWQIAEKDLGVPAGREKTVVLEIGHLFRRGAARKLRLRTNLEIYWDRLQWAAAAPETAVRDQPLTLEGAQLQPRGFSRVLQRGARSPEIPLYDQLAASGEQWRAIEGYYTRYGDVLPLLTRSDDRFVIAGSGDELRLRFAQAAPCPPHWIRDFVFAGDGWMKEGDYSFRDSKTLLPLPYHAMKSYDAPFTDLEHDPAFLRHRTDWQIFHTRFLEGGGLQSTRSFSPAP